MEHGDDDDVGPSWEPSEERWRQDDRDTQAAEADERAASEDRRAHTEASPREDSQIRPDRTMSRSPDVDPDELPARKQRRIALHTKRPWPSVCEARQMRRSTSVGSATQYYRVPYPHEGKNAFPSRIENKVFPQRNGMPDVWNEDGILNDAYVWGMIKAAPDHVLEDWGHEDCVTSFRKFRPKSRPAAIFRWLPTNVQERITEDETGWTSFEKFAAAMTLSEKQRKRRCTALDHTTGVWRQMMHGNMGETKCRFEGTWFVEDLIQLGIDPKLLKTRNCVDLPIITEATPVGIRAHSGTQFKQSLKSSNVTPPPLNSLELAFHKVVRDGHGVMESIYKNGLYPNANQRDGSFMTACLPHTTCFISAINDTEKM